MNLSLKWRWFTLHPTPPQPPNLPTPVQPLSPISTCHMWLFHQALIVGKINVLFDRSIIVQPQHHTVPQCPWKGRQCPTRQTPPILLSYRESTWQSLQACFCTSWFSPSFVYSTVFLLLIIPPRLIYFNTLILPSLKTVHANQCK